MTTLADWLRACSITRLDAQVLVETVLGWNRARQAAHPERVLDALELQQLDTLADRLRHGEPLAYVLGQREFYGLMFEVTPDVLIPRPETELLVELALRHLDALPEGHAPAVLDLGTGSGAIAVAIAHARPWARVWAVDTHAAALAVAQRNAQKLLDPHRTGGALVFQQSDWWSALALPPGFAGFDCIVSNPPYIAAHDPHLPALRFEPSLALTGQHPNADGLDDIRKILGQAARHLRDDGSLLLEHGYDQAQAVRELFAAHAFREVFSARDLAGIERISGGVCPRRQTDPSAPKIV